MAVKWHNADGRLNTKKSIQNKLVDHFIWSQQTGKAVAMYTKSCTKSADFLCTWGQFWSL